MNKRVALQLLLIVLLPSIMWSQRVAVKNNLAYDGLLTPNVSVEVGLNQRWSVDLQLGMNTFFYSKKAVSEQYKTTKLSHFLVQPEARYWFCETFYGLFAGLHLQGGAANIGGINIPFVLQNKGEGMKQHRYEAFFFGGGLSVGYHLPLLTRWSLEFEAGAGYNRIIYDKFPCKRCGLRTDSGQADYLGPTKLAISVLFML